MARIDKRTHQKKFLKAFETTGTIVSAAETVGIDRRRHYVWLAKDPSYPERFESAIEAATQSLEREAIRRSRDGWDESIYEGGKQVGTKRRFSDSLLIFLLKSRRPIYRESGSMVAINQHVSGNSLSFIETPQPQSLADTASILASCGLLPTPGGTLPADGEPVVEESDTIDGRLRVHEFINEETGE